MRSLKPDEWPMADQAAWAEVRRLPGRLTCGGSASHLSVTTLNDLARRYGLFLEQVSRALGKLDPTGSPAGLVTRGAVETYVAELKLRVSTVTVYGSIAKLRRMAEFLAPKTNYDWLRDIENDCALEMIPASKFNCIVGTERIVEAGFALMEEAEITKTRTPLQRAQGYRNGLMISILALCPIRLKNLASLTIDKNFIKLGENWLIVLGADDTKERRPDERPVPNFLSRHIGVYLKTHRPTFSYAGKELWVGTYGRPLSYSAVERIVTETTRQTLGIPISPHLFRSCAASSAYMHARATPNLASAVLNHRGSRTTQEHYNRSKSAFYCHEFGSLLDNL
ncbi:MAG: site-specific integrase [Aestuariivirga sp.]